MRLCVSIFRVANWSGVYSRPLYECNNIYRVRPVTSESAKERESEEGVEESTLFMYFSRGFCGYWTVIRCRISYLIDIMRQS